MKHLILLIITLLLGVSLYSQRHTHTDSKIDWDMNVLNKNISYPDGYFHLYMKRARLKDNSGPKLSYWRSTIFKQDSMFGAKFGLDIDMMAEYFEKSRGNTFRHWNRFRMGVYLIANNNIYHPFETNDILQLFDAELTLSYMHIPQRMRGDHKLFRRKGYVKLFFSIRSNFENKAYIGVKPWGVIWIKGTYNETKYLRQTTHRFVGIDVEVLVNKNGYNNGTTKLTKDYYKGFSFIAGSKYDFISNSPYLHLGIRLQTRNH